MSSDEELSDNEEPITARKVLDNIENAWLNERFAPEILPYETDMLELMLGQIAHMEEVVQQIDKNDFRSIIHRMEVDRIRYIIASYLRCRLSKIENYTLHILKEEERREESEKRLSENELLYAKQYHESIENYIEQMALKHMPANLQKHSENKRIVMPNNMSHVFLKANVAVPSVIIGNNDEEVTLVNNSIHLLPYKLVDDLILNKNVQLI